MAGEVQMMKWARQYMPSSPIKSDLVELSKLVQSVNQVSTTLTNEDKQKLEQASKQLTENAAQNLTLANELMRIAKGQKHQ